MNENGIGTRQGGSRDSQRVHRTDHAQRPFVENMRVDHRGLDVGMGQERLHGAVE